MQSPAPVSEKETAASRKQGIRIESKNQATDNVVRISEGGLPILIVDVEDLLQLISKALSESQSSQKSPLTPKKDFVKKHILIVEDSLTVREAERHLLENAEYSVTIAVDDADGWNALNMGMFDLVVTDLDMPRVNGVELVKRIRENSRLKGLPVIIVSHKDRPEDRKRGLEMGVNSYSQSWKIRNNFLRKDQLHY